MQKRVHWVLKHGQLMALINPVRHEILDRLTALGPLSARRLAQALGRKQTAIYQHLRTLERAGLIFKCAQQQGRGGAIVYRPVAALVRLARAPRIPGNRAVMAKMARTVGAQAARDYSRGFQSPLWTLDGPARNHWFFRLVTAPSPGRLRRINTLLDELAELIWTPDPNPGPVLHVAWFISPAWRKKTERASSYRSR
jgi:DNA-binding transcriptional ArsR family regulator